MKMEVIKISMNEMIVNATKNYADILGDMLSEDAETFNNVFFQFRDILRVLAYTENLDGIKALFNEGDTFNLVSVEQKELIEKLDNNSEPYMIMIANSYAYDNDILGVVPDEMIQW